MKGRGIYGKSVAEEIVGDEKEQRLGNPLCAAIILGRKLLEANRPERYTNGQRYQCAVRYFPNVYLSQWWWGRVQLNTDKFFYCDPRFYMHIFSIKTC